MQLHAPEQGSLRRYKFMPYTCIYASKHTPSYVDEVHRMQSLGLTHALFASLNASLEAESCTRSEALHSYV